MVTTKKQSDKLLVWMGGIYVLCVSAVVLYAWFAGSHLFDLSLTISLYAGLFPGTSVLFFLGIGAISVLLGICLRRCEMGTVRRFVYYAILLCVLGCGCFPCNRSRSVLTTEIHDIFSYALVLLLALSFLLMAALARTPGQRRFGICSSAFAGIFIAAFVRKFPPFKETILIWENVLMILFFLGISLEKDHTGTKKHIPTT